MKEVRVCAHALTLILFCKRQTGFSFFLIFYLLRLSLFLLFILSGQNFLRCNYLTPVMGGQFALTKGG
jgi:hypothetical protein